MKPILVSLIVLAQAAFAQSFTYVTENSQTTITGFSAEPSGAVTVPATLGGATVTAIERAAFKDHPGITAIAFTGASVTKIGAGAFQGCTALTTISFPSGVTALPAQALLGCTALQSATLPSALMSIGDAAFADCRSLATLTLPATLTSIGQAAFSNCRSLTAVTLPAGVTAIPDRAFAECHALTSIGLPAGIARIGNSAFYRCPALTSFALPASTAALGDDAFGQCAGLTAVTVNAALATLGDRVFQGCGALASITVNASNPAFASADGVLFDKAGAALLLCPEGKTGGYTVPSTVSSLGAGAFARCDGLESVTLPPSLSSLPDDAFYYAGSISSLVLPSGLTSIGAWALGGCQGLSGIVIPASVTSVGDDAFHHASSLEWALFKGNAPATGGEIFDDTAEDFTVYHFTAATGFTSPLWRGYPAQALGIPSVLADWLIGEGLSPGSDVESETNGVSLLLAYALGLDPGANPVVELPQPVLSGGQLSLNFQGNRSGIHYSVETSEDLATWTTEGVTMTGPDTAGNRSASVPVEAGTPSRFLRIVADYE